MGVIADELREELTQPEFSEGYAESFLNSYIATQIRVIRQHRQMTQAKLAEAISTKQTVVSRIEDVNYSSWTMSTLKRLAHAFELRLKVSFEEYGTLPEEVESFSASKLVRAPRSEDPNLVYAPVKLSSGAAASVEIREVRDISHHPDFRRNPESCGNDSVIAATEPNFSMRPARLGPGAERSSNNEQERGYGSF